jgi:hypothetical protein
LGWCWQQGPREESSTLQAKPAGVGNDHRRRRSGNASCDQLKERPPVGDPRKLCRFSSRGCWQVRFTVARRRMRKASKTASSVQVMYLHRARRAGGASRMHDRASKTGAKSKDTWDVAEKAQVSSAVIGRNSQRLDRPEDLKSDGTANERAQEIRDGWHQAEVRQMKSDAVARRHAASREASLLAKDQL